MGEFSSYLSAPPSMWGKPMSPASGANAPSGTASGYSGMQSFGNVMAVAGAINSAVGGYYSAKSNQYQLKSQALDLEFAQTMAGINARAAEQDAVLELAAGQREAGKLGLQYRAAKASMATATAAGGIQAGVGSAAEVQTSISYAKEADMIGINANAVRAANTARMRAVDYQNQGRMAGVSAKNARATAKAISPWATAGSSLVGSAGTVARQWAVDERSSARYQRGRS